MNKIKTHRTSSPHLLALLVCAALGLSACSGASATDKLQGAVSSAADTFESASGALDSMTGAGGNIAGAADDRTAASNSTDNPSGNTADAPNSNANVSNSAENASGNASNEKTTAAAVSADGFSTAPPVAKAGDYGSFSGSDLPAYSGEPYAEINGNTPFFTDAELSEAENSFEDYSSLDALGRCGAASASIGQDLMPDEERGSIGQVKPSGWQTVKYDVVDGKYLYNRCHLIGYQLSAENANPENLITGTRALNVDGMLPFENMVADYVQETGNHVLYRVTPVFTGDNLVADGVLMEAESVEDHGADISYNVFVYNVQPGVAIDYATGDSVLASELADSENASASGTANNSTPVPEAENTSNTSISRAANGSDASAPMTADTGSTSDSESANIGTSSASKSADDSSQTAIQQYVLNTSSRKFHLPSCSSAAKIKDENRTDYEGSREELLKEGYEPCGICKP